MHIEEDGSVTPCCVMPSNRFPMGSNIKEYLEGSELAEVKSYLTKGLKHPNCEWCWDNERHGLKSHRATNSISKSITHIHLRLNNVCNFKCRMCNPNFSSSWEIENKKHKYFKDQNTVKKDIFLDNEYLFDLLKTNISNGTLEFINISGGEPLITDAHWKLLTFLIDNKLTDVSLAYSTNLSNLHYKNVNLLDLWKQFKNVTLEASVDGWGPSIEYSRTGFKRETFLHNLSQVIHKVNVDINCVVNVYSVWTLPEVEKFRNRLGCKIIYSPCYLPEMLNPQRLLPSDKKDLYNLYKGNKHLERVYDNFIANDLPTLGRELVDYNLMLDSYRGTNFFEVFPQYRKYMVL